MEKNIRLLKRSTHAYCPACCTNLSEYNMMSCEGCGLVFGDIEPVFGCPEARAKRTKRGSIDELVLGEKGTENKKRTRESTAGEKSNRAPLKKSSSV